MPQPLLHTGSGGLQRHHRIIRMSVEKYPVHAVEAEIAQQPFDAGCRALEVEVMAHAGRQRHAGHARLLRIDFPRMEIEHARTPFVAVDAPETAPEQRIRQQPEKSAPATWPVAP